MTYDKILQRQIWNDFFINAPDNSYSIYFHAKYGNDLGLDPSIKAQQIKTMQTEWGGMSLVLVELDLLQTALSDQQNQRFYLLSYACIPLYNFTTFQHKLLSHRYSMFDIIPQESMPWNGRFPRYSKLQEKFPEAIIFKHSQWLVLIREHAQFLVQKQNRLRQEFRNIEIPDEAAFGVFLSINGKIGEIWNRPVTATYWATGLINHFDKVTAYDIQNARSTGAIAMRKVKESAVISDQVKMLINETLRMEDVITKKRVVINYEDDI
eukprot:403343830